MFGWKQRLTILLAIAALASIGRAAAQDKTAPGLTIDQLIEIKHPSNPVWSPDGSHIAFLWNRAGVTNLYLAAANGADAPVSLTSFRERRVSHVFWNRSGDTLYFAHKGNLWQVASTGGQARQVWSSPPTETDFAPSPDGARVAFVREGADGSGQGQGSDLVVRYLGDGTELKLAHDDVSLQQLLWSPDGTHLAYVGGAKIIHHDESPAYSGAKLIYSIEEEQPGQLFVIPSTGGTPTPVATKGWYEALGWGGAGHLVFARQSNEYKKRAIYVVDVRDGSVLAIREDVETKFWSLPDWEAGPDPVPSPDGRWVAFLSDQDGWDHLYVVPLTGGATVQITRGKFEAWRPAWSHDSTRIAFDANEPDHPGDRRVGVATIGTDAAHARVEYITAGQGTNVEPEWSVDDRRLVYQHTDTRNSADLFVTDAKAGAKPVRLSDSMPSTMDRESFVAPEFVHYPGPDGLSVPGWLFVPKGLDRSKKHPAIIWIHGDGINQNYDGWHVQRNYAVYYSFHQRLLQEGYVVFAPDYRGSIGYGRDWRNGVYMDVGGNDAKDAWMAASYLKTLPYVDADRIGIWGLSYGGFFTLIAMTDQPKLFRAGIDVAGVVDYVMYFGDPYHNDWTVGRIGTPEENPKVYANASPISHIDRLARPLLVLHGTADVNVPFVESVWLMDEVLKKGKGDLVTFMIYPGEFHYFEREHVLRDAWQRVDDFFAAYLGGDGSPPPAAALHREGVTSP
ncbi:MAG TPA: prolyl oligopeptidase family serine peptidase [Terriglobales bacterium]|nr:prolyl oligopeptidase family serine peptidase [Terriglobales bacterium]